MLRIGTWGVLPGSLCLANRLRTSWSEFAHGPYIGSRDDRRRRRERHVCRQVITDTGAEGDVAVHTDIEATCPSVYGFVFHVLCVCGVRLQMAKAVRYRLKFVSEAGQYDGLSPAFALRPVLDLPNASDPWTFIIGRGPGCHLHFPGQKGWVPTLFPPISLISNGDVAMSLRRVRESLSRRHAEIKMDASKRVLIYDTSGPQYVCFLFFTSFLLF